MTEEHTQDLRKHFEGKAQSLREMAEEQCFIGCFGICPNCKIKEALEDAASSIEHLLNFAEMFDMMSQNEKEQKDEFQKLWLTAEDKLRKNEDQKSHGNGG